MSLHDKKLELNLLRLIQNLEHKIDCVGPTPLRHKLSELAVEMRLQIRQFDQDEYEHPKG